MVEFALALKAAGAPISIHVSDCSSLVASMHVSNSAQNHVLPPVTVDSEIYLDALLGIVQEVGIDILLPLTDLDLLLISRNRNRFLAIGCVPIVAVPTIVEFCNDKKKTFEFCREAGLPTPASWFDTLDFDERFPILQKPIFGSGSSGLKRLTAAAQLDSFVAGRDMLQTIIDGEEFGLDILNNLVGEPVSVCVKRKILMRAGETDKAQIVRDDRLEELGWNIAHKVGHIGNLDCDILRSRDGALYCIDFNPRFGGGYPTTHLAGFNYLQAIVDMVQGRHCSLPSNPQMVTVMKGISLHCMDNP